MSSCQSSSRDQRMHCSWKEWQTWLCSRIVCSRCSQRISPWKLNFPSSFSSWAAPLVFDTVILGLTIYRFVSAPNLNLHVGSIDGVGGLSRFSCVAGAASPAFVFQFSTRFCRTESVIIWSSSLSIPSTSPSVNLPAQSLRGTTADFVPSWQTLSRARSFSPSTLAPQPFSPRLWYALYLLRILFFDFSRGPQR